ncbi:MAG: hypothetical protein ACPGTP_04930 [Bacteroidia bacterium]
MKYLNRLAIIALALSTFSLYSCKDDDESKIEPAVEFHFSSPESGAMFGKGDTVFMTGMLHWEEELHGFEITLTNITKDSVVYTAHAHEDTKMMNISQMWINNVTEHSDMKLTIDALTDHDGAEQTKEIDFHCHPMKM